MSLFDIFGTSDQQAAANAQTSAITTGYNQLSDLYGQAQGALGTNYGQGANALNTNNAAAISSLGSLYGQGAGAANQNYGSALANLYGAYGQGAGSIAQGYGSGLGSLFSEFGQGANALNSNYAAGLAPYLSNYGQSQQGTTQLANLLGINGASGSTSAMQSLQSTPGYQFQLQGGENAVLANQAATGQLASGNTDLALNNYAQGLAGTTYQNAVNNLQPYLGYSTSGAGGLLSGYSNLGTALSTLYQGLGSTASGLQAGEGTQLGSLYQGLGNTGSGVQTGLGSLLANIYSGQAGNTAGVYSNLGNQLSNLYQNQGNQSANLYQGQGNAAYGAQSSIGNAQANADLAGLNASANLWGGLLGLGSAGIKAYSMSDEKAKEDIEEVGRLHSGEPVVRYRMKGEPQHQIGLIAQHVERVTPDAVREFKTNVRPMKYVDYKRATDLAAGLAKFLKEAV